MRFAHRANTNVYRLLTFLTPLKNRTHEKPTFNPEIKRLNEQRKTS